MKLNKREIILFSLIIGLILFAIFWFMFLTPIRNQLDASKLEYDALSNQDLANQAIINSVSMMQDTQSALENDLTNIEQSLIPYLNTEIITNRLVSIFHKNGMNYVTEIQTTFPDGNEDRIMYPDGSISPNSTSHVEVTMKISGTDGVTNGGIPFVGYDQFIKSVKEISMEDPEAIHIKSITMEDSGEGFQTFGVTVDVYAFNIVSPVSNPDLTHPYVIWDRPLPDLGGLIGMPYWMCIPEKIENSTTFKPFATYSSGSVIELQVTNNTTNVPTETDAQTEVPAN